MSDLPEITEVQRLPQLQPGDSLIIRIGDGQVTPHVADRVQRMVREILRLGESVPVIVLGPHSSVEVLPLAQKIDIIPLEPKKIG